MVWRHNELKRRDTFQFTTPHMKTEIIRPVAEVIRPVGYLRESVAIIGRNTPGTTYTVFRNIAERNAREQRRRERRTAFINAITPTRLLALFKRG